jgi:hypothetical protein
MKFQDTESGNNYLSTKLIVNGCNSVFLSLENESNDTINIVGYFVLEYPQKGRPFMLFCLSDSLILRKQSNENGFDFKDTALYYYSTKFYSHIDLQTNEITFDRLYFCQLKQHICLKEILPKQKIMIPINYYAINTYMFIRFQTVIFIKQNFYWIQKETNSIFMPECK